VNARRLAHDWFDGTLPEHRLVDDLAYIESTFGMTRVDTVQDPGLVISKGAGVYGSTALDIGPDAQVRVGAFTCLNNVYVISNRSVSIGSHCLISWGVVITDTDLGPGISPEAHSQALRRAAKDPDRRLPPLAPPKAVVIEDVVWIGFGSVIMPGVTVGRGAVVGCKTVVDRDVPPGAVVVGNPFRIIRYIDIPAG
jgi:acetyltransferase-like isoleucine patch superfamily enzyme